MISELHPPTLVYSSTIAVQSRWSFPLKPGWNGSAGCDSAACTAARVAAFGCSWSYCDDLQCE
jgi:hypothetical protein